MSSILEIVQARRREAAGSGARARGGLRSAIIIRVTGTRYVVNDGANAVTCDSMLGERLREGDRVWIGDGVGSAVILGLQGRDVDFAP